MTMLLCVGCIGAIVWGAHDGWPWWAFIPLSLGAIIFFFAEADDE